MNTIETLFVPYELAVKLKAPGFDEPCLAAYYAFGNGKLRNGSYRQTESELFINGIGKELEDRMDELEMFAYHDVSVPTFSQAFRFFREKYEIYYTIEGSKKFGFQHFIYDEKGSYEIKSEEIFKNYEEAESACLIRLIEIVEKEQENDK